MIFRIRKDPNNPYVMVNKGFVYDSSLSAKAKGILLYLLSRPDNWQVYEMEISKHFTDGREAIRSGLKELVFTGYIKRTRERDEKGRLRKMNYEVFEIPQQVTKDGFPNIGEPDSINNDLTKTENNDPYFSTVVDARRLFQAQNGLMVDDDVLKTKVVSR